jgi:hypothetical protein
MKVLWQLRGEDEGLKTNKIKAKNVGIFLLYSLYRQGGG